MSKLYAAKLINFTCQQQWKKKVFFFKHSFKRQAPGDKTTQTNAN